MKFIPLHEWRINDIEFIGIVRPENWWGNVEKLAPAVIPTDYVVCKWHDFHDGVKNNIEAKQTLGIFRALPDAMAFMKLKREELKIQYKVIQVAKPIDCPYREPSFMETFFGGHCQPAGFGCKHPECTGEFLLRINKDFLPCNDNDNFPTNCLLKNAKDGKNC